MRNPHAHNRTVVGILAGVLVGILGPGLVAVATHSGNEPALARTDDAASIRRGATATFTRAISGGYRQLDVYVWVEDHADADATQSSQQVERGARGEAVATVKTCIPTCSKKTWRAPIGAGSGVSFASTPDQRSALLRGTLSAATSVCNISLVWLETDPSPPRAQNLGASPGADAAPPGAAVRGSVVLTKHALTATRDISCWSGGQEAFPGQIWSAVDASTFASAG